MDNVPIYVVLTDPGNEIDDELLLWMLMTTQYNSICYIVCVPYNTSNPTNDSITELDNTIRTRIRRVNEVFPGLFDSNNEYKNDKNAKFILGGPEIIPREHITVNFLIHIAPIFHINVSTFNNMVIRHRIVQGDLEYPNQSINLTKSVPVEMEYLFEEYNDQQKLFQAISHKTTEIKTSFARNVPLTYTFMSSVPYNLKEPILATAFKQFVSRVNPSLKWAEDISIVNHKTIMAMLPPDIYIDITTGIVPWMNPSHVNDIKYKVKSFLKDVKDPSPAYVLRLEHIAMAVFYVTGVLYVTDKFTADDLIDDEYARMKWDEYIEKHQCNLTPAYDVLAWIVVENGFLPDTERCIQILNGDV
jgi:hypothetical protein